VEHRVFFCNCELVQHQVVVSFEDDPDFPDKDIYFDVISDRRNSRFRERVKQAVLFILGRDDIYHAEVILNSRKAQKLIDAINEAISAADVRHTADQ